GGISWENNIYRTIDIAKGGTTKVTVNSNISCWYPRELYVQDISYVEIPETALYEFTLAAGKNYEFTNTSTTADRNITNNSTLVITFDYVKKDASGGISWENNIYRTIDIAKGGTTKVTANSNISCWYPRELYVQDISYVEIPETALYEFTMSVGKTYEFVNSSLSNVNITNNSSYWNSARYDYYRFDQNSNLSTSKSYYGTVPIYANGRTIVYVSGTSNVYGWYPRELFEAYITYNEIEPINLVYPTDIVHSFYQDGENALFDSFYGGYAGAGTYIEISDLSPFLVGKDSDGSFVSLPKGSYTVLGFKQPIVNRQGIPDLYIKGTGVFYEEADVFVSSLDGTLHYLGMVTENKEIMSLDFDDAGITEPIIAVMIVGRFEGTNYTGFDIVEVSGFTNPNLLINTVDVENAYETIRNFLLGRLPSKWSDKAPMTIERSGMGVAQVNGKIYAVGGENYLAGGVLESIEEYDPQANMWSAKTGILQSPRLGFGIASANNKIYIMGGSGDGCTTVLEEYDPSTDLSIFKAPMRTARYELAAIEANGKIYAIGGVNENGFLNTVEEYDPLIDKWVYKASMPTARAGMALASIDGKIYAIGGHNEDERYLDTVEIYDPAADIWSSPGAILPVAGTGCKAVVMDGRIYVVGGWNGNYLGDIAEFNPATGQWRMWEGLEIPRTGIGVTVSDNMIYVIGGCDFIEGRYSNLVNVFEGGY
ncbi:MAG: kelch repeat-containing protein, partial [Clostridiaceae bacterium]